MGRNKKKKKTPPSPPLIADKAVELPQVDIPQKDMVLTVAEVCELLKISRSTLLRANIPGKLKIGGSVRYHKETLDRWILEQIPVLK